MCNNKMSNVVVKYLGKGEYTECIVEVEPHIGRFYEQNSNQFFDEIMRIPYKFVFSAMVLDGINAWPLFDYVEEYCTKQQQLEFKNHLKFILNRWLNIVELLGRDNTLDS